MPLAPLHQPHNLAAIDAVAERLPDVPQVACFDTSFHRGQPAVAELVPLPREICATACSATASTACPTSTSPRCCRGRAGDRRRARDRRAPRQRRQPLRAEERQEHRQHARLHRARRAVHGHAAGRARSRRGPLPVPEPGLSRRRRSRRSSTRSRACSASPGSATTCATCSAAPSRRPRLAVDYFVYRAAKEIGALAAVLGGLDGAGLHRRHRRELGRDPPADLRGVGLARHRARRGRERAHAARGSRRAEQPRVGLGDPDQRRTDDRPAHGPRCWDWSTPSAKRAGQ